MSDLISRQAVLDELEKWDWQELYLPIHFKQILDDVPSVENKGESSAFEGMTNNEVHKAIFGFELDPRYLVTDDTCICGENCPVCPLYDKTCNNRNFAEWLDSPYQKGGE